MKTYLVTAVYPAQKAQLSQALNTKYPGNHIQIRESASWVVADEAGTTALNVSEKLGINEEDPKVQAVIVGFSDYYGHAPTNLWEWIAAKLAESP